MEKGFPHSLRKDLVEDHPLILMKLLKQHCMRHPGIPVEANEVRITQIAPWRDQTGVEITKV